MSNTNCLEGVRCPQCGYEDGFYISTLVELYVADDGPKDQGGDHEWEAGSPCRCGSCGHQATVRDFRIENQEALRLQLSAPDLLEAAELVVARWEHGDLAEAVRALDSAIAKAKGGAA
jgi:hypothetical protein